MVSFALIVITYSTLAGAAGTSRQIEVLAIGATMPQMTPIVPWLTHEPLTSVNHVVTRGYMLALSTEKLRRLVRLYFPRNYQDMLEYDVFVYIGGSVQFLDPSQIEHLKVVVSQDGRGALADLGGVSGLTELVSYWVSSGMYEIFPSNAPDVISRGEWSEGPFWVRVIKGRDNNPIEPLVDLGIEKVAGGYGRLMVPREGSTTYADMQGISFKGFDDPPFLLGWDYGTGRTMIVAEFLNHPWFQTPGQGGQNAYAQDVLINMLLNTIDRPVYQDILLVHEVRELLGEFHQRYSLIVFTLDFVERFGANTNTIRSGLLDTLILKDEASEHYLDIDMSGAMESLGLAFREMDRLMVCAMRLKERALFWIYIIEWFTIMGTLMASGSILYMVMVRRRLFRNISQTRLGSRERTRES
jgi:hypothetical protein